VKGIRCIGNISTKSPSEYEDEFLAGNEKSKIEDGKSNGYFLDFLVGAAAFRSSTRL
jgi:hypothetical protein